MSETSDKSPLLLNKAFFPEYAMTFPEMRVEVAKKAADMKKQPVGFLF